MRSSVRNRFTIYDAMEARGAFASNPANADSRDEAEGTPLYEGPIPYPKMMYHPEGKRRVIVQGETVMDLIRGPLVVCEQSEIIWEIVRSAEDEARLRAAGWHDHPAKAMEAGGLEAPPMSSEQRIGDLTAELARVQGLLDKAQGGSGAATATTRKRESAAAAE